MTDIDRDELEKAVRSKMFQKSERMKEDYRRTFVASKHGQRVLDDLLKETGIFAAHVSERVEGRRDIGLMILSALDKNTYRGMLELGKLSDVELLDLLEEDNE